MLGLVFFAALSPLLATVAPVRLEKGDPVPPFVLQYAPVSHLSSLEQYWPSDISVHLPHVAPEVDFEEITPSVTLQNISSLRSEVFLTATDDVATNPAWIVSAVGRPDADGLSTAPTTIVLVEKANNTLDAFFYYFYEGGKVILGIPFDDHVGDWEHNMLRLVNGTPIAFYLSAHSGGFAFTFGAIQKTNGRPTNYIATGTHANYATTGQHCHDLPANLLCDHTDGGPVWVPALNYRAFWFDLVTSTFSVSGGAGAGGEEIDTEGASWLEFQGSWGDEQYPIPEHGQYCVELGGEERCHWTSGPTGPIAKNLARVAVCEKETNCRYRSQISQQLDDCRRGSTRCNFSSLSYGVRTLGRVC